MLVTYPYRKYLSTYAAGFVDTESREVPEGLAAVAAGLGRTLGYLSTYPSSSRMQFN